MRKPGLPILLILIALMAVPMSAQPYDQIPQIAIEKGVSSMIILVPVSESVPSCDREQPTGTLDKDNTVLFELDHQQPATVPAKSIARIADALDIDYAQPTALRSASKTAGERQRSSVIPERNLNKASSTASFTGNDPLLVRKDVNLVSIRQSDKAERWSPPTLRKTNLQKTRTTAGRAAMPWQST